MARIKAKCSTCGEKILNEQQIKVRVCIDNDQSEYSFSCPTCSMTVVKACSDRIVDRLLDAGVELVEWSLPSEIFEPRSGPAISHRDLFKFRLSLQDDDALASALRQLR